MKLEVCSCYRLFFRRIWGGTGFNFWDSISRVQATEGQGCARSVRHAFLPSLLHHKVRDGRLPCLLPRQSNRVGGSLIEDPCKSKFREYLISGKVSGQV